MASRIAADRRLSQDHVLEPLDTSVDAVLTLIDTQAQTRNTSEWARTFCLRSGSMQRTTLDVVG